MDRSFAGQDYPESKVQPAYPKSIFWYESRRYRNYLPQWKKRWEIKPYLEKLDKQNRSEKK